MAEQEIIGRTEKLDASDAERAAVRYGGGKEESYVVTGMRLNNLARVYCTVKSHRFTVWLLYHRRCRLRRLTVPHFSLSRRRKVGVSDYNVGEEAYTVLIASYVYVYIHSAFYFYRICFSYYFPILSSSIIFIFVSPMFDKCLILNKQTRKKKP